jgi:DNA-binding NarL/FixJ family response regulator
VYTRRTSTSIRAIRMPRTPLALQRLLTPRQSEVLHLVGLGKTTKEIASALDLSTSTIRAYRRHICNKLSVHSTAELIVSATHYGNSLGEGLMSLRNT